MILLAGKILSAKGWQGLGETGKAEMPKAKELTPGTSPLAKQQTAGRGLGQKSTPGTRFKRYIHATSGMVACPS